MRGQRLEVRVQERQKAECRRQKAAEGGSLLLTGFCLLLTCVLAGCVCTSIKVRVPKDVAMARAFVRQGSGFGVQGSGTTDGTEKKAKGSESALAQYLKERQKTERYEAVGDTVTDSIGNIMSAISPFAMLSAISGHWARVVEASNDCESLEWKFTDDKNAPSSISTNLEYDSNDRPRLQVKVTYTPETIRAGKDK